MFRNPIGTDIAEKNARKKRISLGLAWIQEVCGKTLQKWGEFVEAFEVPFLLLAETALGADNIRY
jgi:hypothetical protein